MLEHLGRAIIGSDGFLIGFAVCFVTLVPLAFVVAWIASKERTVKRMREVMATGDVEQIDAALGADASVDSSWGGR